MKKLLYHLFPLFIIKNSSLFDQEWYSEKYQVEARIAAKDYLTTGWLENRDPSPLFSTKNYLESNTDVHSCPLLHYEVFGKGEHRKLSLPVQTMAAFPNTKDVGDLLSGIRGIHSRYPNDVERFWDTMESYGNAVYRTAKVTDQKTILLISRELHMTDAALALKNLADALLRMDYQVIVFTLKNGPLAKEYTKSGISVIVSVNDFALDILDEWFDLFDFAVINTIACPSVIDRLRGRKTPILWWIHESDLYFQTNDMSALPEILEENVHVFCPSFKTKEALQLLRSHYEADDLYDTLPEVGHANHVDAKETRFAIVGTSAQDKGYEILIQALRQLPDPCIKQCTFTIVGMNFDAELEKEIDLLCSQYANIRYDPYPNLEEMNHLYDQTDYLICLSADGSTPLAITEAWQHQVAVICSENIGQAKIIEESGGGIVYPKDDPSVLASCIAKATEHVYNEAALKREGYANYRKYFSNAVFDKNLSRIISNALHAPLLQTSELVSVVIPTYNGGDELTNLISCLQHQANVKTEIILVDSGSTDHAIADAPKENVSVIKIDHKDFSHSGARNLGADKAQGKYLLFMTQDALPDSDTWLQEMLQPLLRKQAVAVSCTQTPRKDSDLLGEISLFGHQQFLSITKRNKIGTLPKVLDSDSLRFNAQLDDVACLICKDIFEKYKYRGIYAEDLDLGIRLIKDGYSIELLSLLHVIHSHNRKASYHYKRALMDTITLHAILEEKMPASDPAVFDKIITAYEAVNQLIPFISANKNHIVDFAGLTSTVHQQADRIKGSEGLPCNISKLFDEEFRAHLAKMAAYAGSVKIYSLFDSFVDMALNSLKEYCRYCHMPFDESTTGRVCEYFAKSFAILAGNTIADNEIADNEILKPFQRELDKMKKGI